MFLETWQWSSIFRCCVIFGDLCLIQAFAILWHEQQIKWAFKLTAKSIKWKNCYFTNGSQNHTVIWHSINVPITTDLSKPNFQIDYKSPKKLWTSFQCQAGFERVPARAKAWAGAPVARQFSRWQNVIVQKQLQQCKYLYTGSWCTVPTSGTRS